MSAKESLCRLVFVLLGGEGINEVKKFLHMDLKWVIMIGYCCLLVIRQSLLMLLVVSIFMYLLYILYQSILWSEMCSWCLILLSENGEKVSNRPMWILYIV